jgi:hypothetical protein
LLSNSDDSFDELEDKDLGVTGRSDREMVASPTSIGAVSAVSPFPVPLLGLSPFAHGVLDPEPAGTNAVPDAVAGALAEVDTLAG